MRIVIDVLYNSGIKEKFNINEPGLDINNPDDIEFINQLKDSIRQVYRNKDRGAVIEFDSAETFINIGQTARITFKIFS